MGESKGWIHERFLVRQEETAREENRVFSIIKELGQGFALKDLIEKAKIKERRAIEILLQFEKSYNVAVNLNSDERVFIEKIEREKPRLQVAQEFRELRRKEMTRRRVI